MVTGRHPFTGRNMKALFRAHLEEELTPPDHLNLKLSAGLGEVVELMMAKDRRERYRTPDDLLIDLQCLLDGQPPKLARERIGAAMLKKLAVGDDEGEDEGGEAGRPGDKVNVFLWLWVLGGLLALSGLLNLVLWFRF
jgi:serine/threonine-protein kinase